MSRCINCGNDLQGTPAFCPMCGSPVDALAKETPADNQPAARSKTRRVALVFLPVVLLAGIIVFVEYINPSVNPVIQKQPVVAGAADYDSIFVEMAPVSFREEGGDIVFSLADLKRYRLVRFEYKTATMTRPLMAYVAPDGRLVTAISVSEHCSSTEFKIKNNKIYCAHCPSYWDMMTMEAYACCAKYYPDPIPSKVVADEVHIAKNVVEKWAGRL